MPRFSKPPPNGRERVGAHGLVLHVPRGSQHWLLAAALLGLASSCTVDRGTSAPYAPELRANVEWAIGVADGDPTYEFGRVSGIAPAGDRVYVADRLNHEIRVFADDGRFTGRFGSEGDGPGELRNPCCIAFDGAGRLWVWSGHPAVRYDVFDTAGGGTHRFRVTSPQLGGRLQPSKTIVLDTAGAVLHPMLIPAEEERKGQVRVTVDSAGMVLDRLYLPYVTPDSLEMAAVEIPLPFGRRTLYMSTPASAGHPTAHSPRGGFADAITSRYRVRWYGPDGGLVRVIEQPIEHGPPYTSAEIDSLAAKARDERESVRSGGGDAPDMPVPSHRHPLADLFFDLDGRLWAERSIGALDSVRIADVYDADGRLLATARWPRRVDLSFGAVSGDVGYGVGSDRLHAPRLVRLTFPFSRRRD